MKRVKEKMKKIINRVRHPRRTSQQQQAGPSQPPRYSQEAFKQEAVLYQQAISFLPEPSPEDAALYQQAISFPPRPEQKPPSS